jgi:putative transposase
MILKAFKYRIYPNLEQKILIHKHFGCARFVYNWGLETRIREYQENNKSLSSFGLSLRLTKLKHDIEWLGEVNAQSLQMSLRNLDNAYTRFFREKKGFPKFKKKSGHQSFRCPQKSKVDFENGLISVSKIKNIKASLDRKFLGVIKTVTISKTPTNKYYASVLVETPNELKKKNKPNPEKAIGVDLGVKYFATLSTGEKIDNQKHLQKLTKKLKLLARRKDRKNKESKRREKARLQLALLHDKIGNQRNDFLHKLSTRLIRENQSVCLEDLNVSGMIKNYSLARSIASASWSSFVRMLKYKAEWYGVNILQIGRFDPSSRMCSCGKVNHDLQLKERSWTCEECGKTHDRDVLAANNIKKFAFDRQSLIENLGKNTAGYAGINAQGDDKVTGQQCSVVVNELRN